MSLLLQKNMSNVELLRKRLSVRDPQQEPSTRALDSQREALVSAYLLIVDDTEHRTEKTLEFLETLAPAHLLITKHGPSTEFPSPNFLNQTHSTRLSLPDFFSRCKSNNHTPQTDFWR